MHLNIRRAAFTFETYQQFRKQLLFMPGSLKVCGQWYELMSLYQSGGKHLFKLCRVRTSNCRSRFLERQVFSCRYSLYEHFSIVLAASPHCQPQFGSNNACHNALFVNAFTILKYSIVHSLWHLIFLVHPAELGFKQFELLAWCHDTYIYKSSRVGCTVMVTTNQLIGWRSLQITLLLHQSYKGTWINHSGIGKLKKLHHMNNFIVQ